jgi:hypothetical protein
MRGIQSGLKQFLQLRPVQAQGRKAFALGWAQPVKHASATIQDAPLVD